MQINQLDLFGNTQRPGFRLDRLEVYNWGTFHKHTWCLSTARGQNLLTGDVGSGKSSLVDALTTLLVPPHRITFNKAAGAEKQERSLYTYIRGAYGNEQDPETNSSRLLTLRDESSYSVLLAVFVNESTQRSITLAQVFRVRRNEKNPDRFYVMADGILSIEKDFFKVKKDISDIRSLLNKREACEVFDSFNKYSTRFRQEFGIKSEQALDLFYQAVSMKSVGNLTEFVRQHMLEKTDVERQIDELCASFEDLRGAHEAILRARHQIELLQPISDLGQKFYQDQESRDKNLQLRTLLGPFFADQKVHLLQDNLQKLGIKHLQTTSRIEKVKAEILKERARHAQLRADLQNQGGGRIQGLEAEILPKESEKQRRLQNEIQFKSYLEKMALSLPLSSDEFVAQRGELAVQKQELQSKKDEQENRVVEVRVLIVGLQKEEGELNREIESLRHRQSNIPASNLQIRAAMARHLGLDEMDLPFVGELLQVKASEKRWEGAIERVLRNFGLSVLVSEADYPSVSAYVNETQLRGKIVYFKVQDEKRSVGKCSEHSLPTKIDIRRESIYFNWLRSEIENNFNYECCESLLDFQRHPKALSLSGQMKMSFKKHEKDDRFELNNRARFVLGWSNKEKIQTLLGELSKLQEQGQNSIQKLSNLAKVREELGSRLTACDGLLHFQTFSEIHWQELAEEIDSLQKQILRIRQESNVLDTLQNLIDLSQQSIDAMDLRLGDLGKEEGRLGYEISTKQIDLSHAQEVADGIETELAREFFPQILQLVNESALFVDLSLFNIAKKESQLRDDVQAKVDSLVRSIGNRRTKISHDIQNFLHHYKEISVQLDASVESLPELNILLNNLKQEDLPRHLERFFKKLKEDTINGMAMFQELLEKERRGIENKIQLINECLKDIDYNPGTFIRLLHDKNNDQEVSHFRHDLRLILSNTTGPESVYTEPKFLEVKKIIDRLKGRPEHLDADRKWTAKVTDVRSWFSFAASERYKVDQVEKEYYPDSGGKSGGQKEKLAYTVLASALAYQYGIEASQDTPKSFRFVMIDEAFGRGSDESARYGLTLFEKLNLQLLVVTPLQKIHVIEDYVNYVHFVHNEGSKNSKIHSLTIEQFKEERLKRAASHSISTRPSADSVAVFDDN